MKKALIIIGIVVGVILLTFVVLGLIGPKTVWMERSIAIKAPKEMVQTEVASWKSFSNWNPFDDEDSTSKNTIEGVDGTVGSKFSWTGEQTGSGTQTISAINDSMVSVKIVFTAPMENEADVFYKFATKGDSTILTWVYADTLDFMSSAMMNFFDMEAMLGPTYEKGLKAVKAIIETKASTPKTYGGYMIEETSYPATRFIAVVDSINMDSVASFHQKTFPWIGKELEKAKIKPSGNPVGVYFSWDMANHTTKLAAALAIDSAANISKIKKAVEWKADASKALKIVFHGDYSNMMAAHQGMTQYMEEKKIPMDATVIEEYLTNPMTEKDTTKWVTNIYYLVK
ncbi:MAG: SRPBCC family protein [Flavobacteriales bacterium]